MCQWVKRKIWVTRNTQRFGWMVWIESVVWIKDYSVPATRDRLRRNMDMRSSCGGTDAVHLCGRKLNPCSAEMVSVSVSEGDDGWLGDFVTNRGVAADWRRSFSR